MLEVDYSGGGTFRKYVDYMKKTKTDVLLPSNVGLANTAPPVMGSGEDPRLTELPMQDRDLKDPGAQPADGHGQVARLLQLGRPLAAQGQPARDRRRQDQGDRGPPDRDRELGGHDRRSVRKFFGLEPSSDLFEIHCLWLNHILETKHKKEFVAVSPVDWGNWHLKSVLNAMPEGLPLAAAEALLPEFDPAEKVDITPFHEFPLKVYLGWREILSGGVKIPKTYNKELAHSREYIFTDADENKSYIVYYFPQTRLFPGPEGVFRRGQHPPGHEHDPGKGGPGPVQLLDQEIQEEDPGGQGRLRRGGRHLRRRRRRGHAGHAQQDHLHRARPAGQARRPSTPNARARTCANSSSWSSRPSESIPSPRPSWITVSKSMADLICKLDGNKTIEDIVKDTNNTVKKDVSQKLISGFDKLYKIRFLDDDINCTTNQSETLDQVYFNLTKKCNLHCVYCYAKAEMTNNLQEMPLKFWNDAVMKLKQLNPKASVCFTGGEALLFNGFWELAEKIRDIGLGLSLITNGSLSRPEDAPRFKSLFQNIKISVDSLDEEINSLTRGAGTLKRIKEFINALIAENVKPTIMVVVTKTNAERLADFKTLFEDNIFITFQPMYAMGRASDNDSLGMTAGLSIIMRLTL